MSHVHCLGFDALEARELLSKTHVTVPHTVPANIVTPIVLSGTVAVDNNTNAAVTTMNPDGSETRSLPIAGRLGTLGKFRGVWNETVDAYGFINGPDVLRLHDSEGTMIIVFNDATPGATHAAAHGSIETEQTQKLYSGTGAYARSSEIGSIDLVSNRAQTQVVSLVLHTQNS
jgi:hypothetical protein